MSAPTAPVPTGSPMLELLAGFMQELRRAGLPVSLTENLDAMEAVKHIPLEDREAFKYALAATLVKSSSPSSPSAYCRPRSEKYTSNTVSNARQCVLFFTSVAASAYLNASRSSSGM